MSTATAETPQEALSRIQSRGFGKNDALVIMAFSDAGVPPEQIDPRHNVLTFHAWKALGRRVAKGATSVRVTTWIAVKGKRDESSDESDGEKKGGGGMRPKTAFLFHESQTIAADAPKGTKPAAWRNPAMVKPGTYEPDESTEPAAKSVTVERDTWQRDKWATKSDGVVVALSDTKREAEAAGDDFGKLGDERPETCNCPMIGVITNVDCPLHGGR